MDMTSKNHTARAKLTPARLSHQNSCPIFELLDRYGAVYSFREPLCRLAFHAGILKPVRSCSARVLVELKEDSLS
jgi:hypothetical protein